MPQQPSLLDLAALARSTGAEEGTGSTSVLDLSSLTSPSTLKQPALDLSSLATEVGATAHDEPNFMDLAADVGATPAAATPAAPKADAKPSGLFGYVKSVWDSLNTSFIPESFVTDKVEALRQADAAATDAEAAGGKSPSVLSAEVRGAASGVVEGLRGVGRGLATPMNLGLEALGLTAGAVNSAINRNLQSLNDIGEALKAAKAAKNAEEGVRLSHDLVATIDRVTTLRSAQAVAQGARAVAGAGFTAEGLTQAVTAPTWTEKLMGVSEAAMGGAMVGTAVPGAREGVREAREASGFSGAAKDVLSDFEAARDAGDLRAGAIDVDPVEPAVERRQIRGPVEPVELEMAPAPKTGGGSDVDLSSLAHETGAVVEAVEERPSSAEAQAFSRPAEAGTVEILGPDFNNLPYEEPKNVTPSTVATDTVADVRISAPPDVDVAALAEAAGATSTTGLEKGAKKAEPSLDLSGKPWYHGAGSETFDLSTAKAPLFLTTSKEGANWYVTNRGNGKGRVHEVAVDVKHPLVLGDYAGAETLKGILDQAGISVTLTPDTGHGWSWHAPSVEKGSPYGGDNPIDVVYLPKARAAIKAAGYDAVYAPHDTLEGGSVQALVPLSDSAISTVPESRTAAEPLTKAEDERYVKLLKRERNKSRLSDAERTELEGFTHRAAQVAHRGYLETLDNDHLLRNLQTSRYGRSKGSLYSTTQRTEIAAILKARGVDLPPLGTDDVAQAKPPVAEAVVPSPVERKSSTIVDVQALVPPIASPKPHAAKAKTVKPSLIDKAIGPRKVGGRYFSWHLGREYTVTALTRNDAEQSWTITVKDANGERTHQTSWDPKRDKVVNQPAVSGETTPAAVPEDVVAKKENGDEHTDLDRRGADRPGNEGSPAGRPGDDRAAELAGEQPATPARVSGELEQPADDRKRRARPSRRVARRGTPAEGGTEVIAGGSGVADAASHVDTADVATDTAVANAEVRGERPRRYVITDVGDLTDGGVAAKLDDNIAAIRLLKALDKQGRMASDAEQQILARYVGWGHTGLAPVVDLRDATLRNRDVRLQKARADLEEVITAAELKELSESTANAHYSFRDLPKAMWAALEHMGFKGGVVLEPAVGTGHFLGTMPGAIVANKRTKIWGIDKEPIAAGIARQLYQDANIQNRPVQEANLPHSYFDVIISNVPFGRISIFDPQFTSAERRPLTTAIHNYYFGKAVDVARPGGLIAFVTSRYTMDAKSDTVRQWVAKHADFLGAVRLPATAFKKTAGTDVVTDVLFLRKREPGAKPAGVAWESSTLNQQLSPKNWQGHVTAAIHTNEYFQEHPGQVLGTEDLSGTMARSYEPQYNVTGDVDFDRIASALTDVLPKDVFKASKTAPRKVAKNLGVDARQGSFQVEGGKVYLHDSGTLVPANLIGKSLDRALAFVPMRDAYQGVLDVMMQRGTDADLTAAQTALRATYDAYVKKFGSVNLRENRRLIEMDPSGGRIVALEDVDIHREKGGPATITVTGLAPIFTKRTIAPPVEPTSADSPMDALTQSLAWRGQVDMSYMQGLMGRPEAALAESLAGRIFRDPTTQAWYPTDEYLSGDVVTKLAQAKAAADLDAAYTANVAALEAVQPAELTSEDFTAPFGATWIPLETYERFVKEEAKADVIIRLSNSENRVKFYAEGYGTHEFLPPNTLLGEWVASALNGELPTLKTKTKDGDVVDVGATETFRESLKQLRERWAEWWVTDQDASDQLTKIYNGMFNREVPYLANGSHIVLPNANPDIVFRPWQKDAIWRTIQTGNTLMAHTVGAGKTFALIGIAGEWKRLGLAQKPMIVVPNHLVEQWQRDYFRVYSSARILVPTQEDFSASNRRRLIARIANNDWDSIVIPVSQFLRISVKTETLKAFIEEQEDALLADGASQMGVSVDDFNDLVTEYGAGSQKGKGAFGRSTERSVKDIARAILTLRARLQKRLDQSKKDAPVTFEELGVDGLLVDEAHLFKNLYFATAKNNIAGLKASNADRAMDMFLKVRLINRASKSRNVVFATGTPVSNAMSEIYTMFRYLASETLDRLGMAGFDSWANAYAEAESRMEPAPGGGYKERIRLRRWTNLRELSALFRRFTDVVTTEDLTSAKQEDGTPYLKLPALAGGQPTVIALDPHPQMEQFMSNLRERIEALRGGKVDPRVDNHLKITTQAGLAAIDLRLVMAHAEFDPNSRINTAAREIAKRYRAPKDDRGVQLVFLDVGVPKAKAMPALPESVIGKSVGNAAETTGIFEDVDDDLVDEATETETALDEIRAMAMEADLYTELRKRLVEQGVKDSEIAYVQQARTPYEEGKLYQAVREGRIRVFVASTGKGGVGMNVQDRLAVEHHLDVPWRPADMEQREGRIRRQGNSYDTIEIVRYVTKRSFDEYRWGLLSDKQGMISSFMRGNLLSMDDVDPTQLDMQVAQALASGDPRTLDMLNKEREMKALETRHLAFSRRLNSSRRAITSGKDMIEDLEVNKLPVLRQALAAAKAWDASPEIALTKRAMSGAFGGRTTDLPYSSKPLAYDWSDADARKAFQAEIERVMATKPWQEEMDLGTIDGSRVLLLTKSTGTHVFKGKTPVEISEYALSVVIPPASHGRIVLGTTPSWEVGTDKFPDFRRSLDAYLASSKIADRLEAQERRLSELRDDVARNEEIAAKPFGQADLMVQRAKELSELKSALGAIRRPAVVAAPVAVRTGAEYADELTALAKKVENHDLTQEAFTQAKRAIWDEIADRDMSEEVRDLLTERFGPERGQTLQMAFVPGAKEFLEEDVLPTATKVAEQFRDAASGLQVLFSPASVSAESARMAGIVRANLAAQWQKAARARTSMDQVRRTLDGMYVRDAERGRPSAREKFLALTDAMEGKGDLSGLSDVEQAFATWAKGALEKKRNEAIRLGLMDSYMEHYFPHEWRDPDGAKTAFNKRPIQGRESYRRQRTIPTVREGVDIGLEPASWNPVELVLRKMHEMDKSITARRILKEGKRAGVAVFVRVGKQAPDGFVRYPESIATVYGPRVPEQTFGRVVMGHYYGPKDAVRILDRYLSPGLSGNVPLFDLFRNTSNVFTQFKLSLSVFHMLTTGLESMVSKTALALEQASRGEFKAAAKSAAEIPVAPIADIIRGGAWLREFYASDAVTNAVTGIANEVVQAGGGFGWDAFEHTNAPAAFMEAIRKGNYPGAAFRAIPAVLETVAWPIMEWWVPRLKMAAFHERAQMELRTLGPNPDIAEVRRVLGQAWDSIDDRFGEIVYRNWFWFNSMKQIGQASLLSLGWNGGSLRLMGGAIPGQLARMGALPSYGGRGGGGKRPTRRVNTGKDNRGRRIYEDVAEPWLHPRMAWLLTMGVVGGMMNAIYQYLMTGEEPKAAMDVVAPRNGHTAPDGSDQRVFLPGYWKDAVAWSTHPMTTASHKVNPMLSFIIQSMENADYKGVQYRNEDDPAAQQFEDWLKFLAKEMQPISLEKAREDGVESFMGINPASKSLTASKAEQKMMQIFDRRGRPTLTQKEGEIREARQAMRRGLASGTPEGLAEAREARTTLTAKQQRNAVIASRQSSLQTGFKTLGIEEALSVYEVATPSERAMIFRQMPSKWANYRRSGRGDAAVFARYQKAIRLPKG